MGELLGWLAWPLVDLLLVYTGEAVVTILTLGRWRGEHLRANEGRFNGPAGALSFRHEGQRVITVNGLLFTGIGFYVLLAFTLLLCWS